MVFIPNNCKGKQCFQGLTKLQNISYSKEMEVVEVMEEEWVFKFVWGQNWQKIPDDFSSGVLKDPGF